MAEATPTPLRFTQVLLGHELEVSLLDPDQHQLGDAVPPVHLVVPLGVVVDQDDHELAAIARVDQAWRVETGHAVANRQPAARQDEPGEAGGNGDRDPGGDNCAATRSRQRHVAAGKEVGTRVPLSRVARHGQLGVELMEGDTQHRRTIQGGTHVLLGWAGSIPLMLAWIDLEMTGLDPARHSIVEIACLVTDDDLTIVGEGPDLVIHASPDQIAAMDDVVRAMHTRSGLLADMEASTLSLADAGAQTLAFLKEHIAQGRTVPLAGNSIGTDRRFLAAQMPEVEDFLHYRSVDVSTVKELCRRWRPDVYKAAPEKKGGHRALQDIRESVAELAYYRVALFDDTADAGHVETDGKEAP